MCSLKPGLPFGVRHPERGQLLRAAPDLRPCRVARVSRSSKGTSEFQTEFDRSKDRLPCCSDELVFPKGAAGKLHRHLATCMSSQTLHLALREGGADNCKTKRHHRLLLIVSTCKGGFEARTSKLEGSIGQEATQSQPWNHRMHSANYVLLSCHCRPKAWRSQRLETKERGSNSHKTPLMPDFLCNASYHL